MTPKNPARVPETLHPFDTSQATSAPQGGVRIAYEDNWPGTINAQGAITMEKAPSDGVYVNADGVRFLVRKGGNIPEGMTFQADEEVAETFKEPAEKRAEEAAPENRMISGAPENRAAVAKPKTGAE